MAVIYDAVLNRRPTALRTLIPLAPAHLQAIVDRTLEKDRELRYQSAVDLRADLELLRHTLSAPVSAPAEQASIVVLPFENLSPNPDNAFFADGLTEEVIADLSKIRALRVISRTSAMHYKGTTKPLPVIAQELNVNHVLEGSVRRAGNSLRITAQLIDASADAHIWAEKYTGSLDDVFELQEKLSRAIVDALKLKLTSQEAVRLRERPIPNFLAYECYLKARHEIWRMLPESYEQALRLAGEGLAILGDNELLYWVMGQAYAMQGLFGVISREAALPRLAECIDKVLALNPDSAKGHALLGMLQYWAGKRAESAQAFRRSLEMEPNDPDVLGWLVSIYGRAGNATPARPLLDRLLAVDPLTPINHTWAGLFAALNENQPDKLLAAGRAHMEAEPASQYACWITLWGLLLTGRLEEEADPIVDRLIRAGPETGFGRYGAVVKLVLEGNRDAALKAVTPQLLSWARSDDIGSHALAVCYALLGLQDEVLRWLENAVAMGSTNYPIVALNPYIMRFMRGAPAEAFLSRLRVIWENQII
jgi:TolB-like protein/predicted Zn-dependent protease